MSEATLKIIKLSPILLLGVLLLAALMQFTIDLYIPSLPAITHEFNSSPAAIQLTLSLFMLGFSLSSLVYGPLSDRIGRRKPLLFGVGLSVLGSLVCLIAPSPYVLILGRFMQGFGIGSCNSVGRSMIRDLLTDRMLAKIGSHIGMVGVFIMAIAPTLGGYFQQYLGWRSNFILLLIMGFSIWLFLYQTLPETNQHLNKEATQLKPMLKNYLTLLKSKVFLGYTLCASFAFAGLVCYLTSAPFLLQTTVGLTPAEFGWLAFFIAGAISISALVNSLVVMEKGVSVMVSVGAYLMLTGGLSMGILGLLGYLNTWVIMIPIAIFSMGAGFAFINSFAGAFHPFPKMAGTAGALYGCTQDFAAALASSFMAMFHFTTQIPLATMLTLLGLASWFAWKFLANSAD